MAKKQIKAIEIPRENLESLRSVRLMTTVTPEEAEAVRETALKLSTTAHRVTVSDVLRALILKAIS